MSDYKSSISKDKNNKYRVNFSYISPETGKRCRSCKRGFNLQKEAVRWQRNALPSLILELERAEPAIESLMMEQLIAEYMDFSNIRRRDTTCATKKNIIDTKIIPFFTGKKVFDVTVKTIANWQNEMLKLKKKDGHPLSATYLRTISNQLSAIFNYAVTYYGLDSNPVLKIERIGSKNAPERPIWTLDEYKAFIKTMEDRPEFYYAFEILYWTGIREGELLSLTSKNFDLNKNLIKITNSYHRANRCDVMGDTKTFSSYRSFYIPQKLVDEIKEIDYPFESANGKSLKLYSYWCRIKT